MNKNIILTAILLGTTGIAAAQSSSVTIYGIVDAGFVAERGGATTNNKITSGAASASRLGFKGSEDLGGGTSAIFTLESGVKIDTGELDATNTLFNRQAFVGLKTVNGTVTLGRQYTPYHNALAQVGDPFGTGYAGGSKNLFPDSGTNVRTSNTVLYTSPTISGFSADVAYAFGEQAGNNDAGRQFGGSVGYANGPLNVRVVYNNKNTDVVAVGTTAAISRNIAHNTLIVANYDFGVLRAYVSAGFDKGTSSAPLGNATAYGRTAVASLDGNEFLFGLSAPVMSGTLLASVQHKNDKGNLNQDATGWGLGYLYPLSKRTNLYGAYGSINNKNGAGYTVANNTETGSGDKAFNLGVRHSF
ncbi:porin [Massilia sp. S19_KUP03_FR1]|uniref:porin n=1 Tax=Massilia sp. S19_KUP03_FR1 TaxID=3025503 RepID=UPI002FCD7C34